MNHELFYKELISNLNKIFNTDFNKKNELKILVEKVLIDCLKKHYKFNICRWEPNNKYFPEYIFLGNDKGILAYIIFQCYTDSSLNNELVMDLDETIRVISYADSNLDRPIFFIKLINFDNKITINFETNEQVKDLIFNNKNIKDKKFYVPDPSNFGDLSNMINIFNNLKKNGVQIY